MWSSNVFSVTPVSPLSSSSSSSSDGEIIDNSKCVLDYIIRIRHMIAFTEFKEIVNEFESHPDTFLERAEKFLDHVSSCLDVSMRKCVIKNSVSKQRLERVCEYETRVKEMILLRRLHDCETGSKLKELDFKRNQLGDDIVEVWGSVTEKVCASRWEVTVEQQRLVGSHLQDPPKDDTSSSYSSMGDENDLGFAEEVDQESTLLDGASSSVLDDLAVINQDLQLNDLLNQHTPPEEVAQELSSSLLDGISRSALDNLALIKRELQQSNDLLHQQALPQEEIAQESSNSEPVDDAYDAVVNNSGLQQVDDQEDVQLDDHVVESPQITLLDGVSQSHNYELQNIESVIAYENVAVNDVGLEQGADHTDILLTEQRPPQDQLVQELSSSLTLTNGSHNNATNEYDAVTNNRGLQQGDGQYGVAQKLSSVGLVDDQNEVAQESSSVACVDDQNEVAEESSAVALVDDILVNNRDLQPVDAQEDEPPEEEEDLVEIWRRQVGVVGTHGDGSRFSLGESFRFIKPLKRNRKRGQ